MQVVPKCIRVPLMAAAACSIAGAAEPASAPLSSQPAHWEPCGWGGGGWYHSVVFHPAQDGVIYLGQDTGGLSKSTDHGMTWRMINNGLVSGGVLSLAVDRSHPDTVFAGTPLGTHKSSDAGEHFQLIPNSGPKGLRITAEKGRTVRPIAVDPVNGDNVYAASPQGKVYKSTDGGMTWTACYEEKDVAADPLRLQVQFGKVDDQFFGGFWMPVTFPDGIAAQDAVGFGFDFQGDKTTPKFCALVLQTADGVKYNAGNLNGLFSVNQAQAVVLKASDFTLDAEFAKKHPDRAAPPTPDWSKITRVDVSCSGPLPDHASVGGFGRFYFAAMRGRDGASGTADKPVLVKFRDFAQDRTVHSYGNVRVLPAAKPGTIYSVAVALKNPALVVAASESSGLLLSEDAGKSWRRLDTPRNAFCGVFADSDPAILYGCFAKEGVWKSTDQGKTWVRASEGIPATCNIYEVAVSPTNPLDVYAAGDAAYMSHDGGTTWRRAGPQVVDLEGDPTRHYGGTNPTQPIGAAKNIAINPRNAKELYIACDWRACWSGDGGATWHQRVRGSDIVCNTDIRFTKGRVYTSGMDVGALVSEDDGKTWRQLWPARWIPTESGHCWRMAINTDAHGVDHIVTAFSPWDLKPKINLVILSEDGGKTHEVVTNGLPDYMPKRNIMWETGFIRALAADPANPRVLYAGIDGDLEPGKTGGGIFKSEDGGHHWRQLAHQPGSRRMFYGLDVDPTDSKRIVWGSCGSQGGVWMTEDGGESWKLAFANETWIWNVMIAKDGRIYVGGSNLWRSDDHGRAWKQLTHYTGRKVIGMETDPRNPRTMWASSEGADRLNGAGIYKTTDDGATWADITGDCPSRSPQILRFNPETQELWCGWVGLYKLKQ